MTTLSLYIDRGCDVSTSPTITKEVKVQVIQQRKLQSTKVIQCSIFLERSIFHCGLGSHMSPVTGSYDYTIKSLSYEQCLNMVATNVVELFPGQFVHKIQANVTTRGEIVTIGEISGSTCDGATYVTPDYTWKDVVVKHKYEIRLYDYTGTVDTGKDQIQLRNGLKCKFSLGKCVDSLEGGITWSTQLPQSCLTSDYAVVYSGIVNKTHSADNMTNTAIYSSIFGNNIFSIKGVGSATACGYPVVKTDHQKIYILELDDRPEIFNNRHIENQELDLFTYFNSKITLLERHMESQLESMYQDLALEQCKLNQRLSLLQLTLAKMYPNDFANLLMGDSGYTAVVAGEVIYLIRCTAVPVKLNPVPRCYQEIPVLVNESPKFMSSITRIIQNTGTELECSTLLMSKFKFGNRWFTIDNGLRETNTPEDLRSQHQAHWQYTKLSDLMNSGIYDQTHLDKMRDVIYDNSLQRSASSYIHRALNGKSPSQSEYFDMSKLITRDVVENAVEKYWTRLVGTATYVGHITSAVLGFWVIWKVIKFAIDTIIHAKILYDIYGLGWQIIASLWDSLTTLMTHNRYGTSTKVSPRHDDVIYRPTSDDATDIEIVSSTEPLEPNLSPNSKQPMYPKLHDTAVVRDLRSYNP